MQAIQERGNPTSREIKKPHQTPVTVLTNSLANLIIYMKIRHPVRFGGCPGEHDEYVWQTQCCRTLHP